MPRRAAIFGLGLLLVAGGCRPSDVLSVPAPAGVSSTASLQNQSGAEGALNGGKGALFHALTKGGTSVPGLLQPIELLTDEFQFDFIDGSRGVNLDARLTAGGAGFGEISDYAWQGLLQARAALLGAVPRLASYEPASGRSMVGEAYALGAYAELFLAEAYCAGTPLDAVRSDGTIEYGVPLSMDSLLGVAEEHFDSALAQSNGDARVAGLASVGLGRTLLDRGQYQAAAAAVSAVPAAFVYNTEMAPNGNSGTTQGSNPYASGVQFIFYRSFNVADREGGNGLNFISAHDPRLMFDTSMATSAGVWYLPLKFEANLSLVPLATGIEAQLIAAEAALQAHDAAAWLGRLNALRNSGCTVSGTDTTCTVGSGQVPSQTTGLPPLSDPGVDSARVSMLFRERAFWLFGTGTRLGDLRRLVRQYGRDQSTVYPTGPYALGNNAGLPTPIPTYGTDVDLTLPTTAGLQRNNLGPVTNPNYKGCTTPTSQA